VRVRLAEAKRLLAETKLPLPDIAVRVGYEHASNLCAVFRRELATRPGAFRSRPER
jgi:AraC family transcriptional regulator